MVAEAVKKTAKAGKAASAAKTAKTSAASVAKAGGAKTAKTGKAKKTFVEVLVLVGWVTAVFFGVQFLVGGLVGWLGKSWIEGASQNELIVAQVALQAIIYTLSCLVIVLVPRFVFKEQGKTTRDELGLRGLPTWTDIGLAPISYIGSSVVGALVIAVLAAMAIGGIDWAQEQDLDVLGMASTVGEKMWAFVALVIVAPIAEEVMFRGWLYGKLRARVAALPAILIVSVLFGVFHLQWNVGVIVCCMSVAMCLTRELTGTIWSGILTHMLRNGVAFYFLFSGFGG